MIICHYYRRIIRSSLDGNRALPEQAQSHIQECPGCRKVYELEMRVVRELLDTAGTQQPSRSPFLHARIMSAIASSDRPADRKQSWGASIRAVGLATACLLLLGVVWMRQRTEPTQPQPEVARIYRPAPFPIDLTLDVKLPDGNQVRQWTGKLDEPLETEMKLVVSDAKTAFNSLAQNFLPEKVRLSLFDQDKGS